MRKWIVAAIGLMSIAGISGRAGSGSGGISEEIRIKKFPVAMQCWTYRKYTFYEAIEKTRALGIRYLQAAGDQALSPEEKEARFNYQMSEAQIEKVKKKLSEAGMEVVSYGVVDLGRTEASMRRVFDFARKMGIRTIVAEPEDGDFPVLEKLVKEYDINIAVHNHAVPTKYAQPETVLDRVKNLDERIGASADTGHWMRSGRIPAECLKILSGRIIDVHLKDRSDFGKAAEAEDAPWGQGKADVRAILEELTRQNYAGFLTVEYENEREVMTPEPATLRGLEYIKSITYYEGYEEILRRNRGRYSKHGWNHYGPGYFELDEKEGVLKSRGGMGLLWYSAKTYRDFILDLEFKCAQKNTNSGVFLRVPGVPTSDDYIYHSFEIQINDSEQGIHKTAAVYDAEAPARDAFKPTGEWNHLRITIQGKHIDVELNGEAVLSWDAEPRGKIKDFAAEGYIGLQNHDSIAPVYFRNIFVKEL